MTVQRTDRIRGGIVGYSQFIPRRICHVNTDSAVKKQPVDAVERLDKRIIRYGFRRVFYGKSINRCVFRGIWTVQDIISVCIIASGIDRIAVFIKISRREPIAYRRHAVSRNQKCMKGREDLTIIPEVKHGNGIVITFDHVEKSRVQIVVGAELPLCGVKLRRMNEKDTANPNDIRRKTNEIMQELACRGEELVRLWQEMRNGTYDLGEMHEICGPLLREVDALYLKLSDLPIPPANMAQWAIRHANLAGDVSDLAILISGSEQEDTARLDEVIRRFHQDLETLAVHRQD